MTFGDPDKVDRTTKPPAAPLLIHIGLHKTGSTWLQQAIFHDPARGFTTETGAPRHQLVHDFVLPDPLAYDPQEVRQLYLPYIAAAAQEGKTLVLSHERLSGYPSSGGYDRALIAERLRSSFPEARILIVLREQRALIRSMYSQHITDGGNGTLDQFLYRPERGLGRRPWFNFDMYAFDRLIELYRRLFGTDRVMVLAYEHLNADPQGFVDAISAFCGQPVVSVSNTIPRNRRRIWIMQEVQRRLNGWFYDNELSPGALVHVRRFAGRFAAMEPVFRALVPNGLDRRMQAKLQRRVDREVDDHFAESNARTAALTGLDLGGLGYMTSGADRVSASNGNGPPSDRPGVPTRKNASMLATARGTRP